MVVVAVAAATIARGAWGHHASFGDHVVSGVVSLPLWPVALSHHGLYRTRAVRSRIHEARRVANAVLHATLGAAVISYWLKLEISRAWLVLVAVFGLSTLLVGRTCLRRFFDKMRARGKFLEPAIVVGGVEAEALVDELQGDPALGYEVVGHLRPALHGRRAQDDVPAADVVERTLDLVEETGARAAIVSAAALGPDDANRLMRVLDERDVCVEFTSSLRDVASQRLLVRPLGRFAVVSVDPCRRDGWRSVAKRAFDVTLSLIVLLLLSPLLLATAVAIKVGDRGPVLFRQIRVGRDGQPFWMLKFRSMVRDAEHQLIDLRERNEGAGPLFKLRDDPRVTPVGRLIRRLSIDELPQLWNVVRGEMSLVGPRPALPSEVGAWPEELHHRLRVKPGITGFWQVSGRSSASFEEYVRFDLYYVDNWSLVADLAILLRTIPTIVLRRGAF